MPLCQLCQSIDFSAFTVSSRLPHSASDSVFRFPGEGFPAGLDLFYYLHDDSSGRRGHEAGDACIPHHKDVEELKNSSAICELCGLIQECVNETFQQFLIAQNQGFHYPMSDYKFFLCPRFEADGFQVLGMKPEGERASGVFKYDVMGGIGFCVDDGNPLTSSVRGRTVPASPTCPSALRTIRNWVARCEAEHRHEYLSARLPTRIIEIKSAGSEVSVRLSQGSAGEYATLSHRWGSAIPTTLNKNTVASLTAGVQTNTLPRSFQDAILLTHELGIRYLWIDSLCILQDDPDDWARESAHMDDVYGHATFTISASRAADSAEGFLSDRSQRLYVSIPMRTGVHSGDVLAFVLPKKYAGDTQRCARLEDEPLTSRGWALQERYLSRRTLHFGRQQMFFECETHFEAEDSCSVQRFQRRRPACPTARVSSILGREWNDVVEEYSRRDLTIPEDKLPALAGLARHFARSPSATPGAGNEGFLASSTGYLAGLRRDEILRDLSWSLDSHAPVGVKPPVYRAPSWSWASFDGAVTFEAKTGVSDPLAIARDARVHLDSVASPYGRVTGGWLYMQALHISPMPPGELRTGPLEFEEDGVSFYVYPDWDTAPYRKNHPDCVVDPTRDKIELFAIPLAWNRRLAENHVDKYIFGPFFLIVEAVDHQVAKYKGTPGFRRVGSGLAQSGSREGLKSLAEEWAAAVEGEKLGGILLL